MRDAQMSSNNSEESATKQQQHRQHDSAANGASATLTIAAATTAARNKRVYFDVETKMHTLSRIDKGEAKSAIIREMHLPPSTLATWIKDRHRIAELYRHSMGRRKRLRRQGTGGEAKAAATVVEVIDPATAAPHLGGPFVTPCSLAAEAAAPNSPDNGSHGNNREDYSEDDMDEEEEESGENNNNHDAREDEEEHKMTQSSLQMSLQQPPPPLPPPPLLQQPVLAQPTATAATIAIPVMRRAPQVVLPRPLVARSVATGPSCPVLQQQQPQQQQQQQPSVTLGLGPPQAQQIAQAPTAAVSLGAFLTTGIATAHHHHQQHQLHQQLIQHPQQQQQQQPQQQQIPADPPLTRAVMEELLQRYVAQMSAILTFTISPMQNSIEQIAQLLAEVRQSQLLARSRRDEAKARWDWLENTKQHPTELDKVLLAFDTSYEIAIPCEWIGECCDTEPDRTLTNLLRKAFGSREKLQQLLPNLAEDRTFRALRHYVAFTQGPVSKDFCTRVAQQAVEDGTK